MKNNSPWPEDDDSDFIPLNGYSPLHNVDTKNKIFKSVNEGDRPKTLKTKLEETLRTAESLTTTLKNEIKKIEYQEQLLKEAIANGRSGVTILIVSTLEQAPRSYIIRDGFWTLCNGMIQYPTIQTAYNMFTESSSVPRCIGQEVTSKRDPCVFNSIIKYETIPTIRRSTYIEEDYLCLKASFNNTLETYMSVPKKIMDVTCKNGIKRSLTTNVLNCGVRVLSEYTYYPHRDVITLPLEYCIEKDGSCKLVVAWHLSNKTIENYEFLKNDQNFKRFFIKSESYIEPFI